MLLALVIGVGREYLPTGGEPRPLPPLEWILIAFGATAAVSGAAGFISWRFTRFVVDADVLRVDMGAIFRRSTRIAFDKVQSIDVVQPFAARMFGLAELQIDIGSSDPIKLRYLQLSRAYALRDYLLARARGHQAELAPHARADSVLADLNSQDEVLIRVAPATLLLAAVTSHEFAWIIVGGLAAVAALVVWEQPWLALGLAVSMGSSLVGFVTRRVTGQFNYTLSRRPHGLRISRGLTSLTSQSLPPRRIQAVQLSQSPVWRRLGLYRVDIEVIGWGGITDDENTSGISTILLPAGTLDQVRVALAAIWPKADFEAVALHRTPPRARWLHPFAQPFLRFGYDDRLVVSRHGWLVRRWQLVPHARTQSLQVSQGVLSRRLGLANLAFHTAGMRIAAGAVGLDAENVLAQQNQLLSLVHHLPTVDLSEPDAAQAAAGPDAFRADQAEATISSTE